MKLFISVRIFKFQKDNNKLCSILQQYSTEHHVSSSSSHCCLLHDECSLYDCPKYPRNDCSTCSSCGNYYTIFYFILPHSENSAVSLEIQLNGIYFQKHYLKPIFPFLLFHIQVLLNFCHKMVVKIIHNLLTCFNNNFVLFHHHFHVLLQ